MTYGLMECEVERPVLARLPRHRSKPLAAALALALGLCAADDALAATRRVNTAGDPGPPGTLSLRQAVGLANLSSDDVVQFDPTLVGSTITLQSGEIAITQPMTISGPGAEELTIDGDAGSRIFHVQGAGPVQIDGVTLTGGVDFTGGAIYVEHGELYLNDSVVSGNRDIFFGGGGIAVTGIAQIIYEFPHGYTLVCSGRVTIQHSSVSGNASASAGGGIQAYNAKLNISDSKISGNSAYTYGGGISLSGCASAYVLHSLVSSNRAAQSESIYQGGAGIAVRTSDNYGGTLAVVGSTVTQNSAVYGGGGGIGSFQAPTATQPAPSSSIYLYYDTIAGNVYEGVYARAGKVNIGSSIIAGNFNRYGSLDLTGVVTSGFSLIRNPGSARVTDNGGNLFGVDPQLGALADNGGPTLSMLPAATSAARDAGLVFCAGGTDQRGLPRCVNGRSDMGALERQPVEIADDRIFRSGFEPP